LLDCADTDCAKLNVDTAINNPRNIPILPDISVRLPFHVGSREGSLYRRRRYSKLQHIRIATKNSVWNDTSDALLK
jgi:hypothetical protein